MLLFLSLASSLLFGMKSECYVRSSLIVVADSLGRNLEEIHPNLRYKNRTYTNIFLDVLGISEVKPPPGDRSEGAFTEVPVECQNLNWLLKPSDLARAKGMRLVFGRRDGVDVPVALYYTTSDRGIFFTTESSRYLPLAMFGGASEGGKGNSLIKYLSRSGSEAVLWDVVDSVAALRWIHPTSPTMTGMWMLPVFPSVFPPDTDYTNALLGVLAPRVDPKHTYLCMGSGSGIDALAIAKRSSQVVDAVDINPIAVANTQASFLAAGIREKVRAWRSDLFSEVKGRYDRIVFDAPMVTYEVDAEKRTNLSDPGGLLLNRLLRELPAHLNPGGKLIIMSTPTMQDYVDPSVRLRLHFEAVQSSVDSWGQVFTIFEVSVR